MTGNDLPCLCGGTAHLDFYLDEDAPSPVYFYKCDKCGFEHGGYVGTVAIESLKAGWRGEMKHARYACTDGELRKLFKGE